MAVSAIEIGATMVDERVAGGNGGIDASAGFMLAPSSRGHSQFITNKLAANETTRLAVPIRISRRFIPCSPSARARAGNRAILERLRTGV